MDDDLTHQYRVRYKPPEGGYRHYVAGSVIVA